MKKLLLLGLLAQAGFAIAQVIPNPWFENWQTKQVDVPKDWKVFSNYAKVSGKTNGNALRLSNNSKNGSIGYAYQAVFDSSLYLLGPDFPYPANADSLVITYRADLVADTATLQLALTKFGEPFPITYNSYSLTTTNGAWKTITVPVSYVNPVDSLIADSGWIMIQSADDINGPYSNGFIEFDDFQFIFKNHTNAPTIPNGTFDNWDGYTLEFPNSWATSFIFLQQSGIRANSTVKTTDFHTGNYALKIQGFTISYPDASQDTFAGFAITTSRGSNASVEDVDIGNPSFPVTQRYQSVRGFFKSGLQQTDQVTVFVNFFKADSVVGSAIFTDTASHNNWYEFAEDIAWDSSFSGSPDSATVALLVCDSLINKVGSLSSWAIFDDLQFDNYPASIKKLQANALRARVYPNPAKENIYIKFVADNTGNATITLRDLGGAVVKEINMVANAGNTTVPIDVSALAGGMYTISLETVEGNYTQKILVNP